MSLRLKTLLFVALVLALQLLGLLLLVYDTQVKGTLRLENEYINESCETLRNAFEKQIESIAQTSQDYQRWDDSWIFIKEPNDSFIESNFTEGSISNLGLDICLYLRNDGETLMNIALNADTGELTTAPESVFELVRERALRNGNAGPDEQGDIAALPEGIFFYAITPVTKTDGSGPSTGFALFGSWLDEEKLADLQKISSLRLLSAEKEAKWPEELNHVERLSKDKALTSISILDKQGHRVCLVKGEFERKIYTHGIGIAKAFIGGAMGVTIVESLIILLLLNRLVLKRVFRLSEQVRNITEKGDSSERIKSDSADELGILARDMNKLLARLNETENGLRESVDKEKLASRAKSQFLANMSHEIRTPMNGIVGMIQLLQDTELSKLQRSYVSTVYSSCEILLTVINDILDLSKVESDAIPLAREPVLLLPILKEVTQFTTPMIEAKGLAFTCDISNNLPPALTCDPNRLKQVLLNLLTNACKFTENGHIKLSVSQLGRVGKDVEIGFEVEDTGIGIAPHQHERIFEPFMQVDSSFTRKSGGTGLGLPISRSLVRQMGGELRFVSEPKKGSTFSFSIISPLTDESDVKKGCEDLFDPEMASHYPLEILLA